MAVEPRTPAADDGWHREKERENRMISIGEDINALLNKDILSGEFEKRVIIARLADSDILQTMCEGSGVNPPLTAHSAAEMLVELWQAIHTEFEETVARERADLDKRAQLMAGLAKLRADDAAFRQGAELDNLRAIGKTLDEVLDDA
jgi:hypothetical protein